MTEVFHLRCDRCGKEEPGDDLHQPKGWARVAVDLKTLPLLPRVLAGHRMGKGRAMKAIKFVRPASIEDHP